MKLILKRLKGEQSGLFALHSEDGEILPNQQMTLVESSLAEGQPILIVRFFADGKNVIIEGDKNDQ